MYFQRLKDLRDDMDLKQEDIAKILKTTRQQYNRYETGIRELPMHHFMTLAKYYNVSLDYLSGMIQHPKPLYKNKTSNYIKNQQNISNVKNITINNK